MKLLKSLSINAYVAILLFLALAWNVVDKTFGVVFYVLLVLFLLNLGIFIYGKIKGY
jgi:hypothetical protein